MIKKGFIFLATVLLSAACMKLQMPSGFNAPVSEADAPDIFVPYETMHVEVPVGTYSVVTVGEKEVATLYESGDVIVPKQTATKAGGSNATVTNYPLTGPSSIASENTLEMTVAFEDTTNGDHDYNDLVFQAIVNIINKKDGTCSARIGLTPVAHGATKIIGLGINIVDSKRETLVDELLCTNVRSALFDGDTGYINTRSTRKHYNSLTFGVVSSTPGKASGFTWYIVVDNGKKLFASCDFRPCLDNDRYPQGMILTQIRDDIYTFEDGDTTYHCGNCFWQYPMEWVNIAEVYPNFDLTFLTYGDFSAFASPVPNSRFYDSIKDDKFGVDYEHCLYTVYEHWRY